MLHPYQESVREWVPRTDSAEECVPGRELLSLLCETKEWLHGIPSLSLSQHGTLVHILYRDTAFLVEEFWEMFGMALAHISRAWPACAFGTAENQETVRLAVEEEPDGASFVQQSLSGKSADVLKTLCYQIDCVEPSAAETLAFFLDGMNWRTGAAAVEWKDASFPLEQGLAVEANCRSLFCYASARPEVSPEDRLDSLDFARKVALWTTFLRDGFEPVEFEWLAKALSEDALSNRLEWELALQEAMEQLQFRMVNREKTFELYDGSGKRVYFGADDRKTAERVFLKTLFPLND